jgi:serine/threonine protein kinase
MPSFDESKLLGFGAFGRVYSGLWNQHPAAIKRVSVLNKTSKELASIEREALIQKKLKHENIVTLFDFSKDDLHAYLVFELMAYGDLFDVIKNPQIPLGSTACVTIGKDIVAGLDYIHKRGFLHRDIKLENIVFNERMQAKITDFGFAVPVDESETSIPVGTKHALAPELALLIQYNIKNKPKKYKYSPATDVFAFGIILLMLISRAMPYNGSGSLLPQIIEGAYNKVPPETSPVLAQVISGCLAINPAERMGTEEIMDLLSTHVLGLNQAKILHALIMNIKLGDKKSAQMVLALNKISLVVDGLFHPIHCAAQEGMLDIIEKLVEPEPELVHVKDAWNQTALLWAASCGHDEIVDFFIKKGVDVNTPTQHESEFNNYSPLDWAVYGNKVATIITLIYAGAKANIYCAECKPESIAKNSASFFSLSEQRIKKEDANAELIYSGQFL